MIYKLVSVTVRGVFFLYELNLLTKKKGRRKWIAQLPVFILYLLINFSIVLYEVRIFVIKSILEILLFSIYVSGFAFRKNRLSVFSLVCILKVAHEMLSVVCAVSSNIIGWLLGWGVGGNAVLLYLLSEVGILFFTSKGIKALEGEKFFSLPKRVHWIMIVLYFLFVCIKIPFLFTELHDGKALKAAIITMLVSIAGFLAILGCDEYKTKREKEKMEADNRRLSAQLHKSKEILPAMISVLERTARGKAEADTYTYRLLEEVQDLYTHQQRESRMEDLFLKGFGSTGLHILDMQLMEYLVEAAELKINMDIFVPQPINRIIKQKRINSLKFQRAIGDIVRNAFRAIERADREEGEVFLIIGCKEENVLEISVMDNGAAFPKEVLQNFGLRGLTEGGTGNGLADLMEFVREEKASLILEEVQSDGGFGKTLSILFDGRERLEIPPSCL